MKFQSSAAVLLAAALPSALAQTWTACNPTEKSCPCDAALGTTYSFDFTKGKGSEIFPAEKYFNVSYESDGVHLPVTKKGDAPTLAATKFILGGKLDVVLKIAPGKGIVSSLVFQSDDLDEIDYEWIGSKGNEVQTNYFGKGNTEQYNRGGFTPVQNADKEFHKYSIEWTKDVITWYLDDVSVRTLTPAQSNELYGSPNYYPQTPMQIKIGSWAAGDPSNSPGVIEWSDGPIDYKQGPFAMVIKSLTLTDYTEGATSYCYGDKTGSWDSIQVKKDGKSTVTTTSASSAASTTSKPASSTKGSSTGASTLETSTTSSAKKPKETTTATTASDPGVVVAITSAMTGSYGGYTPGPENKGVDTASVTGAVTTATSLPGTNSASSVRRFGLGGLAAAAFAALFVL